MSTTAKLKQRSRTRYSSVLESALVGLGREDAVVQSARKVKKKRHFPGSLGESSSISSIPAASKSSTGATSEEDAELDPFAQMKLKKTHKHSHKKREKLKGDGSPAVTRSATKKKRRAGVLEMLARTPQTRSVVKKRRWISPLREPEMEPQTEDEVVIQKKLFQSPEPKKKSTSESWEWKGTAPFDSQETGSARLYRKAVALEQWSVVWPVALAPGECKGDRVQLVLIGQVHGASECFIVGKREGPRKFTSSEGEYISLAGPFNQDEAKSAGMPKEAMELMKDGIPSYFHKKLLKYVQGIGEKKRGKAASKAKPAKKGPGKMEKNRSTTADKSSVQSPIKTSGAFSTPVQSPEKENVYTTPTPKKRARSPTQEKPKSKKKSKVNRKNSKQNDPDPDEEEVWTTEQLEALSDAKLKIPTTASNFWAQVAQFVPGKSASDCQKKTFERFKSPPTNRKPAKKAAKQPTQEAAVPSKIARAGSNKFKKQVREFVEEYEKKHVDDLFDTTPSKEGLPELPDFDALKSPELATPSRSFDEDDSDFDDEAPGLLKKLSSRKRDDIDSYVLGINRQHVAGGGVMKGGKVRRVTAMSTPVSSAKTKASAKKKAVQLVEEFGSHSIKGVVSPGGTTRVQVEKDGSSSEDEDELHTSEEEEDCDIF